MQIEAAQKKSNPRAQSEYRFEKVREEEQAAKIDLSKLNRYTASWEELKDIKAGIAKLKRDAY